ncbi:MAG: hypothetical protein U1E67_05015 [Hyphomicrobiales bacterium]
MTALAVAAGGSRLYAGSFAGMWRSEDGGEKWTQLTWPQPALGIPQADVVGALHAPHIFDIAASPTDVNLVLVSALDSQFIDRRDGIYRSTDGGATWTLVLKSTSTPTSTTFNIAFAPDDSSLVYAAGTVKTGNTSRGLFAFSRDAGASWTTKLVGASLWHLAVGPREANGTRRIYAIGDSVIWYSKDAGLTWRMDNGVATIVTTRQQLDAFQKSCDPNAGVGGLGGSISGAVGDAAQILAIEPGTPSRVYLATGGGANGPSYYRREVPDGTLVNTDCRRLGGEASLWVGDFTAFETSGSAQWRLLPGPPDYFGATTPSGNRYVVTKPTSQGFLLFFSDNSHVHVSAGMPTSNASWHRLDGMDASEAKRKGKNSNIVFMHVDPHAIAFTEDFEITLKPPSGVTDPYDKNSELDQHVAGRLWMANDGGVYWCDDGGVSEASWQMPTGLETLDGVNIAGLFGHNSAPALYMGCGDNNDFFTRDGGAHWGDPHSNCGDCDAWFTDIAKADWVLQFLPRRGVGEIGIIRSNGSNYPDASDGGSKAFVPSTKIINFNDATKLSPCASSGVYLAGYRPLIRTIATEAALPDGDVVIIEQQLDGTAILLRTTAIRTIKTLSDWNDPAKAQQIGPTLPASAVIVQASGGHAHPTYFVSNRFGTVWRLDETHTRWDIVVPKTVAVGASVGMALQWFVDPYDPRGIYVLDPQGMKVTADGGDTWFFDTGMTNAITGGGKLVISKSLLQDMQFSRGERQTRFAMGTAGVICTMDFGVFWFPILNSVALPGRPESGFFDPLSNQSDRAFYVCCENRSILRIGGLPALSPFQPGQPLDLMMFAGLDY